ncbi:MAG TPA: PEGA domain-containing protein [Anaeromyxobacteraceae bacterium]|nr:PEGA domain-containing protein [Anaeromyxobacteraceae bacterium]
MRRLPAALLALAVSALPAVAGAAPPAGQAVLGLRPAEERGGATAIAQLAEAQQLRAVLESVVELLSGAPLRHDDLRAALGRAYLVELFDCRADAACQLKVAAPLRARGVATAIAGEYWPDGSGLRVRVRRLDLARGRVAGEATFSLSRADAAALPPWRAGLGPLFDDTGSVALVVNVAGAACTIDGHACGAGPDGVVAAVSEGEHLVSLAKEGYRRADRVVTVKAGERLRVAVALEELPIQAVKAPDPSSRLPTFEAPGEEARVRPFGFLRLEFLVDDVDAGEREEPFVQPGARPGSPGLVVLPRPALIGVSMQAPRQESGWQLRGALATAFVKDLTPEIDSAYAELLREDLGFRLLLGWGQSIVSSLTAGTLTLPEGFGDLSAGLVGVTVSQSLGPVLVEGFVGKHKSQLSADAAPGSATPAPFVAARLAYVDPARTGTLYGEPYPLTVSASAVIGEERVGGADEAAWAAGAGVAAPVAERVRARAASVELYVPLGSRVSLAGEGYLGEDVHLFEGALWQRPRVDPVTGRHRALRSAGGWGQVTVALGGAWEVRALAGIDRIVGGLGFGRAPLDAPAVARNELAAVNAVWQLVKGLSLGLQLHAVRTAYEDRALGRPVLHGATFTSQLRF